MNWQIVPFQVTSLSNALALGKNISPSSSTQVSVFSILFHGLSANKIEKTETWVWWIGINVILSKTNVKFEEVLFQLHVNSIFEYVVGVFAIVLSL